MRYSTVHRDAKISGHRRACVAISASIVTGIPIKKILKEAERVGKQARYGMTAHQKKLMYDKLNLTMQPIEFTGKTARTFKADHDCIVSFRGHVAAYKDGRIEDWTNGRQHRVLGAYRLIAPQKRTERLAAEDLDWKGAPDYDEHYGYHCATIPIKIDNKEYFVRVSRKSTALCPAERTAMSWCNGDDIEFESLNELIIAYNKAIAEDKPIVGRNLNDCQTIGG